MYNQYKKFKKLLGNYQTFSGFLVLVVLFFPIYMYVESLGGNYKDGIARGIMLMWLAEIMTEITKKWDKRIEEDEKK